jgi:nucleoside-diphosphate-sugar epimerase
MRISIFGSRGFIGTALVTKLREEGVTPVTPDRSQVHLGPPAGGWGTVVWAAGLTADFRRRPHDTVAAHVGDLNSLLRNGGVERLVYLSSTRVYQRSDHAEALGALPVMPTDPSDLYNLSKLMGESLSLSCGLEQVLIARLSNIVGPGEASRETFLGAICREAMRGEIRLQSAGASAKDYLWIDDATRVLAAMARDEKCGIVNVASGRQITNVEWAKAISEETGAKWRILPDAVETVFPAIDVSNMVSTYGPAQVDPLVRVDEFFGGEK